MVAPIFPQDKNPPAPGGGDGHKYLARVWIPGQGYHYTYGPGHNVRTPNMLQRIKDLAAKQMSPPGAPTPPQLTPPPETGQGLEKPMSADQAGEAVPSRTLDRQPGSGGRPFFAPGDGDPSPSVDHFVTKARGEVRQAILLLLHERCTAAPLSQVWQTIEPHLDAALDAGTTAALADRPLLGALFRGVRGNVTLAAHLLAAERWAAIAAALCRAADASQYTGQLAHIARPPGGFPAYDAAMTTISDLREQGMLS
jgi:hypothetical protein